MRDSQPYAWQRLERLNGVATETAVLDRLVRALSAKDDGTMVLLHGFIKKSQATPLDHLALAVARLKQARS